MSNLDFEALRNARATTPDAVARALASRSRRDLLGADGKLMIIAADHPARAALGIGSEAMAMANREDLLERLATALANPGVDGVLATPDIIDDLALLGLLENKIVVGSMNRGGLRGASFEMDDRFGAYSIDSIVEAGLDFAKTLTRVNFQDAGTAETLMATAHAVNEATAAKLPIMLEPFISERVEGKIENILTPEAVIQSIAIVSALGGSSAYTWLKIPYVADMARVMESTTLPTLILGGDRAGDMEGLYAEWATALTLPGVRGLVVGRSLLYPASGSTADAIARAVDIVHGG
ncbi:MAG: deoxyribose-phosphate aldolase [Microbacteriaceae bacterium]|jgi:DhnA family fructose-bisphosphate aldolase class Ia|nr:deoxyribose-phosphate aldolase [Microbacteriaceae bacterium]